MLILRSRVVLPGDTPEIAGGAVAVDKGIILGCGPAEEILEQFEPAEQIDLGECAILPGLINAHTHLELSCLKGKIPYQSDFIDWIRQVTSFRRLQADVSLDEVIPSACRKSLESGVTTVGDVCFRHRAWPSLAGEPIRKTCFAEVFGMTADLDRPRQYLDKCIKETKPDSLLRLGLSPHAPYTAGPDIYRMTAQLAAQHGLVLTTHLAETTAERDFLMGEVAPWREYLKQVHHWDDSFIPPWTTPVEYFLSLDLAKQPFLLAHVNYISEEELEKLSRSNHSVVYCPRSHHFFGHPQHPWRKMLSKGINVCLGTDSLASNESLSILDEMRWIYRNFPDFPLNILLRMATINAAAALGWDGKIGVLQAGKDADIIAIPLTDLRLSALVDIMQSAAKPIFTMVQGDIVHKIG